MLLKVKNILLYLNIAGETQEVTPSIRKDNTKIRNHNPHPLFYLILVPLVFDEAIAEDSVGCGSVVGGVVLLEYVKNIGWNFVGGFFCCNFTE